MKCSFLPENLLLVILKGKGFALMGFTVLIF